MLAQIVHAAKSGRIAAEDLSHLTFAAEAAAGLSCLMLSSCCADYPCDRVAKSRRQGWQDRSEKQNEGQKGQKSAFAGDRASDRELFLQGVADQSQWSDLVADPFANTGS